jgi:hypothetical protein
LIFFIFLTPVVRLLYYMFGTGKCAGCGAGKKHLIPSTAPRAMAARAGASQ